MESNKLMQDIMLPFGNSYIYNSEANIYSRYIKYTKMDILCNESIFADGIPSEINIYIDLYQFMTSLYRFENIIDKFGVTAALLNLPIHYRNYFNKLGIKSNIFLIFSSNDSINNFKYLSNYNSKYRTRIANNRHIMNITNMILSFINTIVQYFPGVYLKIGTVEPTVIVYDLIDKFTKNGFYKQHVFITSTDYSYQLPVLLKNTFVFYKKNTMLDKNIFKFDINEDKDNSFVIYPENALFTYILKTKNKDIKNIDEFRYINQRWISPFMILNGLEERTIKPLVNSPTVFKTLNKIKEKYQSMTPENIYNALLEVNKKTKITRDEIFNRYFGLDLDYQLKLYRQLPESLETGFLKDLNDMNKLYELLGSKFVGKNYIDISKL